jgi:hypothetical protein
MKPNALSKIQKLREEYETKRKADEDAFNETLKAEIEPLKKELSSNIKGLCDEIRVMVTWDSNFREDPDIKACLDELRALIGLNGEVKKQNKTKGRCDHAISAALKKRAEGMTREEIVEALISKFPEKSITDILEKEKSRFFTVKDGRYFRKQ